jgi:hypothetical protein
MIVGDGGVEGGFKHIVKQTNKHKSNQSLHLYLEFNAIQNVNKLLLKCKSLLHTTAYEEEMVLHAIV